MRSWLRIFFALTVIVCAANAQASLRDVVESYTSPDGLKIPERAIEDVFEFFDCNRSAQHWHNEYRLVPNKNDPSILEFDHGSTITPTGPAFGNQRHVVIFDLDQPSWRRRLHVIDLQTGEIISTLASHGKLTDCGPKKPGYACRFAENSDEKGQPRRSVRRLL